MTYDNKTVTVKISRKELRDILVAIHFVGESLKFEGYDSNKWEILYGKLIDVLTEDYVKNGVNEHEQN